MPSALFINRVFPPDEGATGQMLAELTGALVKAGWKVTVAAGVGRHGHGSGNEQVSVQRVRGLPFTRASVWRRALSYLSLYPALLWRALRLPKHDVVVTLTDPPLHLALAPVIGLCKGSRLVHWAQDLYPEVAVELQVLGRRNPLTFLLRSVSNWSLRRHHVVVAVGECMKERLTRRGIPADRVRVIPNWSLRPEGADDAATGEAVRRERGWEERFVVMYSGNLGLAHPFEGILAAIEKLRELEPRILFVLVGEGAQLERVRQRVGNAGNVEILPRQPLARLDATLRAADVHLASMFERMAGLVVPSKVYGIVAAERPCVFLGPKESEAARLLVENQCGVVLRSDDGEGLARLLQDWCANPNKLAGMRDNARRLAPEIGVERAVREFLEVVGGAAGVKS